MGFFLSQVFGPHVAGTEIGLEGLLQGFIGALGPFVKNQDEAQHRSQQDTEGCGQVEKPAQDDEGECEAEGIADDRRDQKRGVAGAVGSPQGVEGLRAPALLDGDGPQEGRQGDEHDNARDYVGPDSGNPLDGQRLQHPKSQNAGGYGHDSVDENHLAHFPEVLFSLAVLGCGRARGPGIVFQEGKDPLGQDLGGQSVCGFGQADDIRREEDGDHRNGHHNGIEEVSGNPQRYSQGCDDEGEFTNLRQGEAALEGHFERLAAQEDADDGKQRLPQHHR